MMNLHQIFQNSCELLEQYCIDWVQFDVSLSVQLQKIFPLCFRILWCQYSCVRSGMMTGWHINISLMRQWSHWTRGSLTLCGCLISSFLTRRTLISIKSQNQTASSDSFQMELFTTVQGIVNTWTVNSVSNTSGFILKQSVWTKRIPRFAQGWKIYSPVKIHINLDSWGGMVGKEDPIMCAGFRPPIPDSLQ